MKNLVFWFLLSVTSFTIITPISAQPELTATLKKIDSYKTQTQIDTLVKLCWDNRSSNPRLSISYGTIALKLIENSNIDKLKSHVWNYLGVVYGNLGNLDSAYHYYQKAIEFAEYMKDSVEIAYSLDNLGDYYIKSALYSAGLEKFFQSYKIFESIGDKTGMAYCLNDIGEVYIAQKDNKKALHYFTRSAKLRKESNDNRGYAKSLINIATVQYKNLELKTALNTFNEAEKYCEKSDYIKGRSYIKSGISDIYLNLGDFNNALKASYESLEIDLRIGNKYGEIISYNKLGNIYILLKQFSKAKEFLFKARDEAHATGHLDQLMVAYNYLTQIAVNDNDFRLAYNYAIESKAIRDSIYSHKDLNKIADLQTAFFVERKNRENELLKKDIQLEKNNRNFLILCSILMVFIVFLLISKNRAIKKANELLNESNRSKDKLFSIIAHDLNNPVGAITSISEYLRTDYDDIKEIDRKVLVDSIADASINIQNMLANLLNWARSQQGGIKIQKTNLNITAIINNLVSSYKLLAKKKSITIDVKADTELYFSIDKFVFETIIGNILTNAIKFSFDNAIIILSAIKAEQNLIIRIKDFGKGITEEEINLILNSDSTFTTEGTNNEKGLGLGLKICKELITLHGAKLQIESSPNDGSTFIVKFYN